MARDAAGAARAWTAAAMALLLASCGDGSPLLFPAPAEFRADASVALEGTAGEPLDPVPEVRVMDRRGNPVPGVAVEFAVAEGDGRVSPEAVLTDREGRARPAEWRLGEQAGPNALRADLGELGDVVFEARADPGPAAGMAAASVREQGGATSTPTADPPAVLVEDRFGNPVPGVFVFFIVEEGGGSVQGSPAVSGSDGVARLKRWVLGPEPGPNRLRATSDGLDHQVFEATGELVPLSLSIEAVHLNQGNQSLEGAVGGVAGRPGLLRVVARATRPNGFAADVRVRLYQGGTLLREELLPAPGDSVPTSPDLAALTHTWNLPLAAWEVVPGLAVEAVLDPDSELDVPSREEHRFPRDGDAASLGVESLPALNVVFVPVELTRESRTGNVHPGNTDAFLSSARRWIPASQMASAVHAPFSSGADLSETDGWHELLRDLRAKRGAEGATDEYYHGIIPNFPGLAWAGFAYVPGDPGSDYRVALSWDNLPFAAATVAHELGHNLGRWHTPCGNPSGLDPDYPHPEGRIGPPGYDVVSGALVSPSGHHDYMSYCTPRWTSDYTFGAIVEWRRADPWAPGAPGAVAASGTGAERSGLLVWGSVSPRGVVLNPAFGLTARPSLPDRSGPHELRGAARDGRELFRISFEGERVAHSPHPDERHFSFVVPLDPHDLGSLDRIELTSPLGHARRVSAERARPEPPPARELLLERPEPDRVRLRWDASRYPAVMVRDPATGQVLAFARGGDARVASGGRRPDQLEVLLSDGVRSVTPRRGPP